MPWPLRGNITYLPEEDEKIQQKHQSVGMVSWPRFEKSITRIQDKSLITRPGMVACSSKTSVDFQRTTRRYIPEDRIRCNHLCEKLKYFNKS
jgi:hypothetical protein